MKRTLSLRRERLAELTNDELSGLVAAGAGPLTPVVRTVPVDDCVNSYPLNECVVIAVSKLCLTRGDTCVNC